MLKYMVIEKILKQLTPERVKKEVEAIRKIKLPPELQRWVKEYEKVGERGNFLWRWIYKAIPLVSLPFVPANYKKSLFNVKFLTLMMFTVLLNDAADKLRNKTLFNELIKIPISKNSISSLNLQEKKYFLFTKKIWQHILKTIQKYPRYKEFREIFNFDVFQTISANQYDYLITKHFYLINKKEVWIYPPQTMGGMICGILDLMVSPKINFHEVGIIREIIWEAQKMARIGNWISTWKKEIEENDLSSGVFIWAAGSEILTLKGFNKKGGAEIISKIKKSGVENRLLKEWRKSYIQIKNLNKKLSSVNIQKMLPSLNKLLILDISSQNLK